MLQLRDRALLEWFILADKTWIMLFAGINAFAFHTFSSSLRIGILVSFDCRTAKGGIFRNIDDILRSFATISIVKQLNWKSNKFYSRNDPVRGVATIVRYLERNQFASNMYFRRESVVHHEWIGHSNCTFSFNMSILTWNWWKILF